MIVRAILGGLIGGFLWLFLPVVIMGGADLHIVPWLILGYAFFGLPVGAVIGGVTGFAIWLVNPLLHPMFRVAIGVGIAFAALGAYFLTQGSFGDLTFRHLWYSLNFSFAIGVPAGLMARSGAANIRYAAEQIVGREPR